MHLCSHCFLHVSFYSLVPLFNAVGAKRLRLGGFRSRSGLILVILVPCECEPSREDPGTCSLDVAVKDGVFCGACQLGEVGWIRVVVRVSVSE